jgi:hypothetical protein
VCSSLVAVLVFAAEVTPERLMRMMNWIGYSDEVGENTYTANGTTMLVSTAGQVGGENHLCVAWTKRCVVYYLT